MPVQGINPQTMAVPYRVALAADNAGSMFGAPAVLSSYPTTSNITKASSSALLQLFDGLVTQAVSAAGVPGQTGSGPLNPTPTNVAMFNLLNFSAFGTGANGTFSTRMWGYRPTKSGLSWVPVLLCELSWTLGATTGLANNADWPSGTSDLIADEVAIVTGNQNVDVTIISGANDNAARALVDAMGFPFVQVQFQMGTATKGNMLWAPMS